jgi:hypothetical protein
MIISTCNESIFESSFQLAAEQSAEESGQRAERGFREKIS